MVETEVNEETDMNKRKKIKDTEKKKLLYYKNLKMAKDEGKRTSSLRTVAPKIEAGKYKQINNYKFYKKRNSIILR